MGCPAPRARPVPALEVARRLSLRVVFFPGPAETGFATSRQEKTIFVFGSQDVARAVCEALYAIDG